MKTIGFALSLFFNAICLVLFAFALGTSSKFKSFTYYQMTADAVNAAAIVSVPPDSEVVFNAVEITIAKGEHASLQFSNRFNGTQSNYRVNALYDHAVIAVEPSGYGILITALEAGETLMQTLGTDGIIDIAKVTVR